MNVKVLFDKEIEEMEGKVEMKKEAYVKLGAEIPLEQEKIVEKRMALMMDNDKFRNEKDEIIESLKNQEQDLNVIFK